MSLQDSTENNKMTPQNNDSGNTTTSKRQRENEPAEHKEEKAVAGKKETTTDTNPIKKMKIDTTTDATESNNANNNQTEKKKKKEDCEILDICEKLNIQDGTRIQVRWIIHKNNQDADDANQQQSHQQQQDKDENNNTNNSISLWWEATLLPNKEKRTHTLSSTDDEITLPIRTLEYDAKPQHGFHEKSLEEVLFLTPDSLMSLSNVQLEVEDGGVSEEQPWRLCDSSAAATLQQQQGEEQEEEEAALTIPATEEATRNMLDLILQSSLSKFTSQMDKLPASSKAIIAEKMAWKKEQMVAGLMKHLDKQQENNDCSGVTVTSECVQRCVADMMKGE